MAPVYIGVAMIGTCSSTRIVFFGHGSFHLHLMNIMQVIASTVKTPEFEI